jgi:putative tryptophan/tyrosine transport system substrate-binding protein
VKSVTELPIGWYVSHNAAGMISIGDGSNAIEISRREFVAGLGGAAVAWPLPARTQQPRMPVIGALHAASREGTIPLMAAYREGLRSEAYVEGQNVAIEYRWAGRHLRLAHVGSAARRRMDARPPSLSSKGFSGRLLATAASPG